MKSKKRIFIISLAVALIFFFMPFFITVGKIYGAESEKIIIYSGKYAGEYTISTCGHSAGDKKNILGKLEGNFTAWAYSSSCEYGCIWAASSGRGEFYMPEE